MIDTHEKFFLKDEYGRNNVYFEVNWNPEDKDINECKIVKVTFPDKSTAHIKREYLNAMLFAISNAEDQRKMIPQKIRRVRWYETVVSVKAKNDIRKGEKITFPIKLSLPTIDEEKIGSLNIPKNKEGILLPE